MNDLFNRFGNINTPNPFSNVLYTMQEFNKFKNNFRGNPQQVVENMVSNGMMSQNQLNQLQQMASQLQKIVRR